MSQAEQLPRVTRICDFHVPKMLDQLNTCHFLIAPRVLDDLVCHGSLLTWSANVDLSDLTIIVWYPDPTTDKTSHSRDFKSQTFRSITFSHLYIQSEFSSFDHDLGLMVVSLCDATLISYPILPLKIDPTTDVYSDSPALQTSGISNINQRNFWSGLLRSCGSCATCQSWWWTIPNYFEISGLW